MNKINRFMKNDKGFTLVELLVVIVIIGILATIAIPRLVGIRKRANKTKSIGNLRTIQTALEMYFVDYNNYPASLDALAADGTDYVKEGVLKIPTTDRQYGYELEGGQYTVTDDEHELELTSEGIVDIGEGEGGGGEG